MAAATSPAPSPTQPAAGNPAQRPAFSLIEPDGGQPILVALRALKLGDLLVAVPALHALRRAFPGHRRLYAAQSWLTDAVELVGGWELLPTHGLDVPIPLAPGTVDVAVNLHGCGPESQLRIAALEAARVITHEGAGFQGPPWSNEIAERERWASLLQWHGIEADPLDCRLQPPGVASPAPGAAVVHVGAAYGSRLWPVDRFAAVAAQLAAAGHQVLLTGSKAERERALAVAKEANLPLDTVVAGDLSLAEFAASVSAACLVFSADTGAAHLASAYGTPSVVLFGPAPVEVWGPPPGPHVTLTRAELRRGETFAETPDPALLAVTVEDALAAIRELKLL